MTTIAEGLTWANEYAALMKYLRARDDETEFIKLLFSVAIEEADLYLGGRDFTDPPYPTQEWVEGIGYLDADPDEVFVDVPIPAPIRLGVYVFVEQCRILRGQQAGLVAESTGAMSLQRDLWAARNLGRVPLSYAAGYWQDYRLDGTSHGGAPKL